MKPILVPSKGRSQNHGLKKLLNDAGVPFTIFVEPEEIAAYKATCSQVVSIGASGRGIAFVRNFILEYARQLRLGGFWTIDDDVNQFWRWSLEQNKNLKVPPRLALETAEALFAREKFLGVGALEYKQFCRPGKSFAPLSGKACEVVTFIREDRIGKIRYDARVALKEDRDFVMQILAAGLSSVRVGHIGFSAPPNASNKGGLQAEYLAGREAAAVQAMIAKWGTAICRPVKKPNGRIDLKINWAAFTHKPSKIEG